MRKLTGILVLAGWFAGLWAQEVQEVPNPQETQEVQEVSNPEEVQEVQESQIPQQGEESQPVMETQEVQESQIPQQGEESQPVMETQEGPELQSPRQGEESEPFIDIQGVEESPAPQEGQNAESIIEIQGVQEQPAPQESQGSPVLETQEAVKLNEALTPQEARTTPEQDRELVPYGPDFEFREGVYANFDMVKNNDPIPTARIVTDVDMFDRDFYEKVTAQKEIVIYDDNGVKKVLETQNIWGYGRNGLLFINVGNAFHRVSFVGSISHFVASVTTYSPNYYDPYYYNPYYSNSYYYNRYNMPRSNYTNTELRQYLLDFETGDVMNYDTESVEVLLMKDPELADEYGSLRNRQKKQMKFVYIRRYNEKHPLYFPSN